MKKVLLLVFLSLAWLSVSAQALVPITWTAYGLTFEAPKGILVEEDTEETFLLNNSKFYITIQSLDSDGMTKSDLKSVLKDYANDDGVKDQSARFVKGSGRVYISGYDATRGEGVALEKNNLVTFRPDATGQAVIEFTGSSRYGLPVKENVTIQVNQ